MANKYTVDEYIHLKIGSLHKDKSEDWFPYYEIYFNKINDIVTIKDLSEYMGIQKDTLRNYFKKFGFKIFRKRTNINIETNFNKLLKGENLFCKNHGLHNEWRVYCNKHGRQVCSCKKCIRDRNKNKRINNPLKAILNDAKNRKKEFNLTIKYLENLLLKQRNKCIYTGIEFDDMNKISLDRIDSNKGYIEGNVQFVIFDINRMKTNLSHDTFLYLCKKVMENSYACR